jgi:hypothetical protein
MIQNGITNFVSMLDNIMVGRVGTLQMTGVSIVNQLIFVFGLCIFGAMSGAGIFTAQFYGKKDKSFRITFDKNILWRDYDLRLDFGVYGSAILDHDKVLMEVKTANSIPLWLCKFLSKNKIYKTSFSKYGNAYKIKMNKQDNREVAESA